MEKFNSDIIFTAAYFTPGAHMNALPELVEGQIVGVPPNSWVVDFHLRTIDLSFKKLKKCCPFLRSTLKDSAADAVILDRLQTDLRTGAVQRGYYLQEEGAIHFPDGSLRFLRGTELIPERDRTPYALSPDIPQIELVKSPVPIATDALLTCLLMSPFQALLVIAYVILSSVRSLVLEAGIDLQAVLYLVGRQGLGKTTLAKRVAGLYRDISSGKLAGAVQARSSNPGTDSLLAYLRDQPVIVEDICLSAGRTVARESKELAAKVIREGTGDILIVKMKGSCVQKRYCHAGVILTAEFPLENLSDLTRCIIVPIDQRPKLPESLGPELMGDVIRIYSRWFALNSDAELEQLQSSLREPWGKDLETRVRTNYGCLYWALGSFIRSLGGCSADVQEELMKRMNDALNMSLEKHDTLRRKLEDEIPAGNLAYCLYTGYKGKLFDLAKRAEKLADHEGVMWEGDLCLRSEALVRFVRLQAGFHDWTRNRISRELKDIGALVLQEEETSTVHLDHGLPRVYRIRLDVLKKSAIEY